MGVMGGAVSARRLPREWGVRVRCDADDCKASVTSGCCRIRAVRVFITTNGWIRGQVKGRRRQDFCPDHHAEASAPLPAVARS